MTPAGDYRSIPLALLTPAGDNPRHQVGDVTELANSIKAQGVVEPLIVEELHGDGSVVGFRIIAGGRRWAAARLAGLLEVPCVVRKMTNAQRRFAMLVENLQRRGLRPIEEAEAYDELLGMGYTQKEIARQVGRSESFVSWRLKLLDLPAYEQAQVRSGKLAPTAALNIGNNGPGPVDLFEADDELNRAWRALRQDAIDSGDRTTIRLLSEFARAFKSYKAMLERKHVPVGSL